MPNAVLFLKYRSTCSLVPHWPLREQHVGLAAHAGAAEVVLLHGRGRARLGAGDIHQCRQEEPAVIVSAVVNAVGQKVFALAMQ